jgi:S-adenosyl methyltransferase
VELPDFSKPNPARVYDRWLGGKTGLAADREAADRLAAACPGLEAMARQCRRFAVRATAGIAAGGTGQFLDLGCGMPADPSIADAAREHQPGARVCYVDNDPLVLSHMRALGAGPGITVLDADLSDTAGFTARLDETGLDFTRPAGVIFGSVLHCWDAGTAGAIVADYTDLLAAGSAVAIAVAAITDPEIVALVREVSPAWRSCTAADVEGWFGGAGLVMTEPVSDVRHWPMQPPGCDTTLAVYGGIGLKL